MKKLYHPHSLNIPGDVAFDERLSEGAIRFYGVIEAFTWRTKICWATTEQLADLMSKGMRTIERWLKELEEASHLYRVTYCQPYLDDKKKTRYHKKREIRLGKNPYSKNDCGTAKNGGIVEPAKNGGLDPLPFNPSNSSKQQQHIPPDSLPSLRSVSESESPHKLSDMDAPTKNFTDTKKLPKSVVAAANNKRKRNSPKNEEDLTNHSIASLLDDVYGSMLQSGEGPPPPVDAPTAMRASHDAAFEKRFVMPSAVGMTITRKENAAVAPEDEDKKILLDQLKDSLTKENLKIAEEYIDCFYEEVFSANNPPGVVIHAIKNDYAKGKIADAKQWKKHGLKAAKQQQLTGDKDAQAAANRPYAKAMYDRLRPKRIHRLFDIELGVNCIIVTYWRNGRLMSHNIGFLEDNFEWKIDKLEKSCWNYIGWIKKDYGHKLKEFHTYEYLEQEIPV